MYFKYSGNFLITIFEQALCMKKDCQKLILIKKNIDQLIYKSLAMLIWLFEHQNLSFIISLICLFLQSVYPSNYSHLNV